MDEATVRQHAKMWAIVMEGQAIIASVEGMKAENQCNSATGHYPEACFADAEKALQEIARRLRDEV